jgi:hypothetical protein
VLSSSTRPIAEDTRLRPRVRAWSIALCTCALLLAACQGAAGVAKVGTSGGGAGKPSPTTASGARSRLCPNLLGSFSVGHWPPACWRPYGSRSPFNVPIPAHPRSAPDSSAVVAYIRSHGWSFEHGDSGGFAWDNGGTRPVFWARASDPLVTVTCSEDPRCKGGVHLHIPAGARPQSESDGHIVIVDQSTGLEWDFYQASTPHDGRMRATSGSAIPVGPARGTGLGGEAEASYLGLLGGLIRAPELAAGRIEHALALVVPCEQRSDVWPSPATGHGDTVCAGAGTGPHFGSLLQLDMSDAAIAARHAPRWQRAIMTAMAHYGMYVVDSGGASHAEMSLEAEDDQSFTSFGYAGAMERFIHSAGASNELDGVPIDVSKLRVIAACVPRRRC